MLWQVTAVGRQQSGKYEEVQAVRWAEKEEILAMIDAGTFIPYHKPLIELLFAMRERADAHFRSDR